MHAHPLGRRFRAAVAGLAFATLVPAVLPAQWATTYESFYLPGSFNWAFRRNYASADRLFNAFDYGHAILYETLLTDFDGSVQKLEERIYDRLTKEILVRPPRVPLEEAAIEVAYAQLVPEAKQMFDWAHALHRQIYDVWADERIPAPEKDAMVAALLRYYRTRPDLAFSAKPKSMALMQEQPYSLAFRQNYPKYNGLIWAYHWLQVGLYEPLMVAQSAGERQAGVRAAVSRFFQMLQDPPQTMPHVMPMTAAISPTFAARYPEAAIIFDNLHSMHDVVSDVLANPSVPRHRKRAEILLAARRFRDDTSFVMTEQAWRTMSEHMGVENMGGTSVSFLPQLPTPTVTYGAVMTHDDRTGEMTGFTYGRAVGGEHAGHEQPAAPTDSARTPQQAHAHHGADTLKADPVATDSLARTAARAMDLYMRMLADPVIRERIMADSAMRRLATEFVDQAPAEHRDHMRELLRRPSDQPATRRPAPAARPSTRRPASRAQPTPPRRTPPPAKPVDPHAGHRMPPPKSAPKDSTQRKGRP